MVTTTAEGTKSFFSTAPLAGVEATRGAEFAPRQPQAPPAAIQPTPATILAAQAQPTAGVQAPAIEEGPQFIKVQLVTFKSRSGRIEQHAFTLGGGPTDAKAMIRDYQKRGYSVVTSVTTNVDRYSGQVQAPNEKLFEPFERREFAGETKFTQTPEGLKATPIEAPKQPITMADRKSETIAQQVQSNISDISRGISNATYPGLTPAEQKVLAENPNLTYSVSPTGNVVFRYPGTVPQFGRTGDIVGIEREAMRKIKFEVPDTGPASLTSTTTTTTTTAPPTVGARELARASILPTGMLTPKVSVPSVPGGGGVSAAGGYISREYPSPPRPGISIEEAYGNTPSSELKAELEKRKADINAEVPKFFKVDEFRVLEGAGPEGQDQLTAVIVPEKAVNVGKDLSKVSVLIKDLKLKEGDYKIYTDPVSGEYQIIGKKVPSDLTVDVKLSSYFAVPLSGLSDDAVSRFIVSEGYVSEVKEPGLKGRIQRALGLTQTELSPNVVLIKDETGEKTLILKDAKVNEAQMRSSLSAIQSELRIEELARGRAKASAAELKAAAIAPLPPSKIPERPSALLGEPAFPETEAAARQKVLIEKVKANVVLAGIPVVSKADLLGSSSLYVAGTGILKGEPGAKIVSDVQAVQQKAIEEAFLRREKQGPVTFIKESPGVKLAGGIALTAGIGYGIGALAPPISAALQRPVIVESTRLGGALTVAKAGPNLAEKLALAAGKGTLKIIGSRPVAGLIVGGPAIPEIGSAIYYNKPFEEVFPEVATGIFSRGSMLMGVKEGALEGSKLGARLEEVVREGKPSPEITFETGMRGRAAVGVRIPPEALGKISPEELSKVKGIGPRPKGLGLDLGVIVSPTGEVLPVPYRLETYVSKGGPTTIGKLALAATGKGYPKPSYVIEYMAGPKELRPETIRYAGVGEKPIITPEAEAAVKKYGEGLVIRQVKYPVGIEGEYARRILPGSRYVSVSPETGEVFISKFKTPTIGGIPSDVPVTTKVEPVGFTRFAIREPIYGGTYIERTFTRTPLGETILTRAQEVTAEGKVVSELPVPKGGGFELERLLRTAGKYEPFTISGKGLFFSGKYEYPPYTMVREGKIIKEAPTLMIDDKSTQKLLKKYYDAYQRLPKGALSFYPGTPYYEPEAITKGTQLQEKTLYRYLEKPREFVPIPPKTPAELRELELYKERKALQDIVQRLQTEPVDLTPVEKKYVTEFGRRGIFGAKGPSAEAAPFFDTGKELKYASDIGTKGIFAQAPIVKPVPQISQVTGVTAPISSFVLPPLVSGAPQIVGALPTLSTAAFAFPKVGTFERAAQLPKVEPSVSISQYAGIRSATIIREEPVIDVIEDTKTGSGPLPMVEPAVAVEPMVSVKPAVSVSLRAEALPSVTPISSIIAAARPPGYPFGKPERKEKKPETIEEPMAMGKRPRPILSPDLFSASVSQAISGRATVPKFTMREEARLRGAGLIRVPTVETRGRVTSREVLKGLLG